MIASKYYCLFIFGLFVRLSWAKNECESGSIDSNGGLFPHESDCSSFYMCEWGKPVRFECPDGLHFNPKTLACDWPDQAGCQDSVKPDNQNNTTPIPDQHVPCHQYPDPICPEHQPNRPSVHLPHPKDCRKFYQCDWEVLYPKTCPEGLHWSVRWQTCDWPWRADCVCRDEEISS